jgi:hypothetical protein
MVARLWRSTWAKAGQRGVRAREADSMPSTVVAVSSTRATTPVARIVYQIVVDSDVEAAASIRPPRPR